MDSNRAATSVVVGAGSNSRVEKHPKLAGKVLKFIPFFGLPLKYDYVMELQKESQAECARLLATTAGLDQPPRPSTAPSPAGVLSLGADAFPVLPTSQPAMQRLQTSTPVVQLLPPALALKHYELIDAGCIKELCVLTQYPHPNIVPIEPIEPPQASAFASGAVYGYPNRVVVQMPHAGLNLMQLCQQCSDHQLSAEKYPRLLATIVVDVSEALAHLHFHSITHGDLKPENVIWNDTTGIAYLIDFGSAILQAGARKAHEVQCTYAYEAFETLNPSVIPTFSERNDVWSLGLIVYAMLLGGHPSWSRLPDPANGDETVRNDSPRYRLALYAFLDRVRKESGKTYLDFEYVFARDARFPEAQTRYLALPADFRDLLQRMMSFSQRMRPLMKDVAATMHCIILRQYGFERPHHDPQPRVEQKPITFEFLEKLSIRLVVRNWAIQSLWQYILQRDHAARKAKEADDEKRRRAGKAVPTVPWESTCVYPFVLSVHILDRYCLYRDGRRFAAMHEYYACALLAYYFASALLQVRVDPPIDLSCLYYEPNLPNSTATSNSTSSPRPPHHSPTPTGTPSPSPSPSHFMFNSDPRPTTGTPTPPAPIPEISAKFRVPRYHVFLEKLRQLAMDMLLGSRGMLNETTWYDPATMRSPKALVSLVQDADYYSTSIANLRLRYTRFAIGLSPMPWFDDEYLVEQEQRVHMHLQKQQQLQQQQQQQQQQQRSAPERTRRLVPTAVSVVGVSRDFTESPMPAYGLTPTPTNGTHEADSLSRSQSITPMPDTPSYDPVSMEVMDWSSASASAASSSSSSRSQPLSASTSSRSDLFQSHFTVDEEMHT